MAVFQSRTVHPIHTQPVTGAHTEAIDDTVAEWRRTGVLIPRGVAQMIASWWQAPGNAFSAFSHTGAVTDDLAREIGAALRYARARVSTADQVAPLLALSAYVGACTVAPYVVMHNAPGCLPDGGLWTLTLDYADARAAYMDLLGQSADILCGDAACACGPDGDPCPPCGVDAHARAILADGDGAPWDEPIGAGEWDRVVYLAPDDEPARTRAFHISRTPMLARDYFAATTDPLPTPDAALTGPATVGGAA